MPKSRQFLKRIKIRNKELDDSSKDLSDFDKKLKDDSMSRIDNQIDKQRNYGSRNTIQNKQRNPSFISVQKFANYKTHNQNKIL